MEQAIERHYRDEIKAGLSLLPEGWQTMFKRMYSHRNLDRDINAVVDSIPPDKLDWALGQVRRSVEKNNQGED